MRKNFAAAFVAIALGIIFLSPALAAASDGVHDGVRLGDTLLRDAKDWDVIHFGKCSTSANIPVTRLGIRVTRHRAEIDRLSIKFWNGTTQELELRERFRPGTASRWIDLRGEARCIKSIRIKGDSDTLGWRPGKQAQVAFWGKR